MTKSEGKPKCAWCKKRLKPSSRGRRPSYCSQSHRQRAYEVRKIRIAESRGIPIRLLERDLGHFKREKEFRKKVIKVLEDCGLIAKEPHRRSRQPQLSLVKDKDRDEKSGKE